MGVLRKPGPKDGTTLISKQSVSGTAVAFTNIPQYYNDLYLSIIGEAAAAANITVQFNADYTANYDWESLTGNSSSVAATAAAAAVAAICGSMGGGTPQSGAVTVEIPGYTLGYRKLGIGKTARWDGDAVANFITQQHAFRWRSTAAINRIDVGAGGASINAVIALYGRR